ncbi:MAG TPA: hypothetical protein VN700_01935 [Vicinamibacterales bacterium]|nr:hypothetical protein [Vicinamibacterales bacterium]
MARILSFLAALMLTVPVLAFDVTAEQLKGKPEFSNGDALGYFI